MDEDLFAQLESPRQIWRSAWPQIQRVAHHLRSRKAFAKYYSPKMVSLGPIHHGEPHLELGEQCKLTWASMYVQRDRNKARNLHRQIVVKIKDLKILYTNDAIRHFNDQQLARMLFLDGCSLLQILKNPNILDPEPLNAKVDLLALVHEDALLLENQLPFQVLQLLSDVSNTELLQHMDSFLHHHHFSAEKPRQKPAEGDSHQHVIDNLPAPSQRSLPAHLLDELRMNVVAGFHPAELKLIKKGVKITHRNLKELKESGIQVIKSKSKCPIDITFTSHCFRGKLKLPEIIVDDTTASTYLNLMAYEACPDFENKHEISSYVEFLDSLIDHPDDVKELRKAKVLCNALGSDEKVAELFNDISNEVMPNAAIYESLRYEIEKHYQQDYKTWFAQAINTHFSNPWSTTAFLAASVALLLTAIQTWFAVFPKN